MNPAPGLPAQVQHMLCEIVRDACSGAPIDTYDHNAMRVRIETTMDDAAVHCAVAAVAAGALHQWADRRHPGGGPGEAGFDLSAEDAAMAHAGQMISCSYNEQWDTARAVAWALMEVRPAWTGQAGAALLFACADMLMSASEATGLEIERVIAALIG